ncbi:hypothetical protein [Rathayibacter tritici]|uniref:hypothetical protein n=1 Tax=Rathayibacter tritici TaxID=33888 RepID=UPI001AD807B2|nr:hypothetical protein [Rathayibacter tritici]
MLLQISEGEGVSADPLDLGDAEWSEEAVEESDLRVEDEHPDESPRIGAMIAGPKTRARSSPPPRLCRWSRSARANEEGIRTARLTIRIMTVLDRACQKKGSEPSA